MGSQGIIFYVIIKCYSILDAEISDRMIFTGIEWIL